MDAAMPGTTTTKNLPVKQTPRLGGLSSKRRDGLPTRESALAVADLALQPKLFGAEVDAWE